MIMETLGQRIRKRRIELGWSQENLAFESKLQKNTIQRLESDLIQNPTPDTLCQLACALEVNLYYLLPSQCLEILDNNPADHALRELCQDLYSKERIDSIQTIITASSAFHPRK